MYSDETLASLKEEMAQLRATIADQQAAIDALQSAKPGGEDVSAAPGTTQTSRRGFLGAAALGAAAAAAGVAAVTAVPTAHAAAGGNVVLGANNDSNATTEFSVTSGASVPGSLVYVYNPTPGATSTTLGGTSIETLTVGGNGVYAHDSNGGYGVIGVGNALGAGTVGISDTGYGIWAQSGSSLDIVSNGTGRIYQHKQGQVGPPPNTAQHTGFLAGESIRDLNGDLWLCVATTVADSSGNVLTPAQWTRVGAVVPGFTGGAISYLPKPIRLFDSRPGSPANQAPGVKPSSSAPTTVHVAGVNYNGVSVPAKLTGAIGNLTVLNESGGGYIELVPSGAGFTGASNIAFDPGRTLANAYTVGLSGGNLDIILGGAGTVTTDVIIDLFAVIG